MKITPEHYEYIRNAVVSAAEKVDKAKLIEYREVTSPKRFRWDLLWNAKITPWITENIYPYADDTHLDTALRQIVKNDIEGVLK